MLHMNNLDLAIFPAMSKWHSELLKEYSGSVVKQDKIWEAAVEVWKYLPSSTVARGFILAFRIAAKVMQEKGSNSFLKKGTLHANVQRDFVETATGVKPNRG